MVFVPPLAAKDAALDAIAAGTRTLVVLTEFIPLQDVMRVLAAARETGCCVVGPNTAGLVTPGECFVGIMPGFDRRIFRPGRIGVISRSGSLGVLLCLEVRRAGHGQSAFIGVGGDPISGTTTRNALERLDSDPRTDAVVIVGEIGGTMEEDAAAYAAGMSKPVFAFIAGPRRAARPAHGPRRRHRHGRARHLWLEAFGAGGCRRHRARHPFTASRRPARPYAVLYRRAHEWTRLMSLRRRAGASAPLAFAP